MSSRTRNPPSQNLDNIGPNLDKLTLKLKRIEPHKLEPNPNPSPEHKSEVWTEVNLEQDPKPKKHVSFFPPDLLQSRPEPPKSAPTQVPSRPVPSRPVPFRPVPFRPVPSRPIPYGHIPSRPIPFTSQITNKGNRWNMSFR